MGCGSSTATVAQPGLAPVVPPAKAAAVTADDSATASPPSDNAAAAAAAGAELKVLVRGAQGLRDADIVNGTSDPYVLLRLGPKGTAFQSKAVDTERCTATAIGHESPRFNFGTSFPGLRSVSDPEIELHLVVMDRDALGGDDFLGEARVDLRTLASAADELRDYDLIGKDATGSVTLMSGAKVDTAVLESLEGAGDHGRDSWFGAIGQHFSSAVDTMRYYATMISFGISGATAGWERRQWFTDQANPAGVWEGPFPRNCLSYLSHVDVKAALSSLGERLGTSNHNGAVYRENFLGYQLLNNVMWPELPQAIRGIGLAQTQENHGFVRPYFDKVVGPDGNWTHAQIRESAQAFWLGRASVDVNNDFRTWCCQLLHKIHFNLEVTKTDAAEWMAMQGKMLIGIGVFQSAAESPAVQQLLSTQETLAWKAAQLARYKTALQTMHAEDAAGWTDEQLTLLTSNMMDSLLFAGGQSVPTVIGICFGLLYSKLGRELLPAGFTLCESNLWQFVMESVRRVPPVSGVAYTERSTGAGIPDQRVILNVASAQLDPAAWGKDAATFRLRPKEQYESLSMGWADAALHGGRNGAPNSHACPAKDLSIVMVVEMLRGFLHASAHPADEASHGSAAPLRTDEWALEVDGEPSSDGAEIEINDGYGLMTAFTLRNIKLHG